jgi:MFS family permease
MTLFSRLAALVRRVAFDVRPLRVSRDYRLVYIGQSVSFLGSMVTYVAVPFQMYALTHSTLAVGLLGAAELGPLLATALVGGALADAYDRRRLVLLAEAGMAIGCVLLMLNAVLPQPSAGVLYALAAFMAGLGGIHRPALESMTPRLIDRDLMPAVGALQAFRGNFAMIAGPALAGIVISVAGVAGAYALDLATFVISLAALSFVGAVPPAEGVPPPGLGTIAEGLRYALARPLLLGTYLVDINAMVFGMPLALFPAIAEAYGGSRVIGYLYGAPAAGALIATLTSGWTGRVRRHGLAVAVAAATWGAGIVGFGLARSLPVSLAWLMLAGAADMISGLFRMTIWNQTIPDRLRGRLAGVEQISYLSGPLLGHLEAGLVAAAWGVQASVVSGGVLAVVGSVVLSWRLPEFVGYRADQSPAEALRSSVT